MAQDADAYLADSRLSFEAFLSASAANIEKAGSNLAWGNLPATLSGLTSQAQLTVAVSLTLLDIRALLEILVAQAKAEVPPHYQI